MSDSLFNRILDVITEQKPRRIGIAFDDWESLAAEIERSGRDDRGRFKEKGRHADRVTYETGDDYVYVMGVFVYRNAFLNRGEIKPEAS